ncbi:MAG: hypothetical protein ACFFC7_16765 [Candidatus Hermodarchaeota archaeon]
MNREKIDAEFREKLKQMSMNTPATSVKAIVEFDEAGRHHLFELTKKGGSSVRIRHSYKNIPAVALEGNAEDILRLSEEKWVERIEEDEEVHING